MTAALAQRAHDAFAIDAGVPPPLSLRGGNAVDSYDYAAPFDPAVDTPTDEYLEGFTFWGLVYLDAQSWRHYLPRLIDYAIRHPADPHMVAEALVRSLRPPDRYPPRLSTLTPEQEDVVRDFLELVALGDLSPDLRDDAQQALEEWWLPHPRARPSPDDVAGMRASPTSYRLVSLDRCQVSLPELLLGSGTRDVPQESRRVEVWGGLVCGDAPTTVAINITPIAVRSFDAAVAWRHELYRDTPDTMPLDVPGADRAVRLDGMMRGDSPAEPQRLVLLFVQAADDLYLLSVRSWPRSDVDRVVEHVVRSFEVRREA